mgnify:CR=1 FL=1|jgi:hypothetical protein
MNERERFIIQFLLRKLNEYAAVVRGTEVAVPDKNMQQMQEARVRNLSKEDKENLVDEIKNEMMISDSFLNTTIDESELPGDENLV